MAYTDPYALLGVSRGANDDEIKKAYHDLARKYHPDKYSDPDLAEIATEKMKDVNAAYDQIQKERASGTSGGTYGNSGGNGGYNGYGAYGPGAGGAYGAGNGSYSGDGAEQFAAVRRRINEGNIVEAEAILMGMSENLRGAEWHFLRGCVLVRRGSYIDAGRCFDFACSRDPYNAEYKSARDQLRRQAGTTYTTSTGTSDCISNCLNCLCWINCCIGGPCC